MEQLTKSTTALLANGGGKNARLLRQNFFISPGALNELADLISFCIRIASVNYAVLLVAFCIGILRTCLEQKPFMSHARFADLIWQPNPVECSCTSEVANESTELYTPCTIIESIRNRLIRLVMYEERYTSNAEGAVCGLQKYIRQQTRYDVGFLMIIHKVEVLFARRVEYSNELFLR
jgi:hypothetical protein